MARVKWLWLWLSNFKVLGHQPIKLLEHIKLTCFLSVAYPENIDCFREST